MLRILHVYPKLDCGGTEMVIYNLIRFAKCFSNSYEILTQKEGINEKIFEEANVKIHRLAKNSTKQYKSALRDFFKQHTYDIIHIHMSSDMGIVAEIASEFDIPHIVAHSHNARIDIPKFLWPLRILKYHSYEKHATDLFGCSQLALKWLFPTRWKEGKVIFNGIDLKKFAFNSDKRSEIRKNLGIGEDEKVCINVGRCTSQKNQDFILSIASKTKDANIRYLIIGDGPLFQDLKNRVENEGLTNVSLLGKQDNIPDYLNAADIFLFPSTYEGLGIVAIEAQASGLPVIASPNIPKEADMELNLLYQFPITNPEVWASSIKQVSINDSNRDAISLKALKSKYNINTVCSDIEKIYNS